MPGRSLPKSIPSCQKALNTALLTHNAITNPSNRAFSDSLKAEVEAMLLLLNTETSESSIAMGGQVDASEEYRIAKKELYRFSRHFIHGFAHESVKSQRYQGLPFLGR